MLLDTKPTLNAFLNRPLIYGGIYKYKINQLYPETFDITTAKGKTVSFQFEKNSVQDIDHVELYIKGPSTTGSVYPKLYTDQSHSSEQATGLYCIDQIFTSKGTHIVHILLNHNYAFTYTVKVR